VRADLRAFFDQADVDLAAFVRSELFEADRCGEAGGAAAYDQHIVFHHFAGHVGFRIEESD
jgi:hypothetical protein